MTKDWQGSVELQDTICDLLGDGKSLRQICSQPDMPSRRTVLRWLREDQIFAAKCARAREDQAEHSIDKAMEIEEGVLDGRIDPAAARVVISSIQWRASKLDPKKYGDKQQIEQKVTISHEDALKELL